MGNGEVYVLSFIGICTRFSKVICQGLLKTRVFIRTFVVYIVQLSLRDIAQIMHKFGAVAGVIHYTAFGVIIFGIIPTFTDTMRLDDDTFTLSRYPSRLNSRIMRIHAGETSLEIGNKWLVI